MPYKTLDNPTAYKDGTDSFIKNNTSLREDENIFINASTILKETHFC